MTSILVAAIPLTIWIYLFLARGNFWQLKEDDAQPQPLASWPSVVVIVPARNEAETIARTVISLAKQDYPGEFHIILADDHSEDGTASLAQQAVAEARASQRVRIHSAAALAPGWTGKLWALDEGIRVAANQPAKFYWFTDADIEHGPDTLRRLVFRAERDALDLTSLMVLLQANSITERLLIPPFLYFFLMLYPPRWIADPKARTAGAAGGCILLRREALERIGGFAAIRGEVIDDCALARAVKKSGGKIWMGLTRKSVSVRGYGSFAEIRNMIARTAFTQLHYSFVLLLAVLAALFVTFLLPWFSFLAGEDPAWFLASTAICVTVRFYSVPWPWALALPITAMYYGYATCVSAVRCWLGRGGQWKGRTQAQQGLRGPQTPQGS